MIALPAGTRIWLAAGVTDTRCGFDGLAAVSCIAIANDEHNTLAMLKRRNNETLPELLMRLDAAIHNALEHDFFTDEINAPSPAKRR